MHLKHILIVLQSLAFISLSQASSQEKIIIGSASWYGEQFHGRKTASGEIFDMNKLTAAHKTLPFGTYLKVTNLETGKSIKVKVNDRGPFKGNRILDVSKKAARELGFLQKGLTKVSITILTKKTTPKPQTKTDPLAKKETPLNHNSIKKKPTMITPQEGINSSVYVLQVQKHKKTTHKAIYKIQLGVYSNALLASKQHKALQNIGIETAICLFEKEERLYRLLTKETFYDYKEANTTKELFHNKYKIPAFIVQF